MKRLELPKSDIRPNLHYPLYETRLHKFTVWLAHRLFSPFMELRVRGVEHVPPKGAAVVTCNHLVDWDVFPLQLALPRMIYYMGKAELFQVPHPLAFSSTGRVFGLPWRARCLGLGACP